MGFELTLVKPYLSNLWHCNTITQFLLLYLFLCYSSKSAIVSLILLSFSSNTKTPKKWDSRRRSENKVNLREPFMRAQSIFLVERLSRLRVATQSEFSLGKAVSWAERKGDVWGGRDGTQCTEGNIEERNKRRQMCIRENSKRDGKYIERKGKGRGWEGRKSMKVRRGLKLN